jgi:DNA-binding PadR family transcriptional regulator
MGAPVDIQANLPLTETSFLIILSLAAEPRHGYAIIKEVETLSDRRVVLATGTLYSALRRMLDDGWIERVPGPIAQVDQRVRKFYQLSQLGRRILAAETARLRRLVQLTDLHDVREGE